tara:strand:+ start:1512 stop:1625 length:114 start_codon:yes stop_codon:yes gene_type:complete
MSHYDEQREMEAKKPNGKDVQTSKPPYGKTAKSAFWV